MTSIWYRVLLPACFLVCLIFFKPIALVAQEISEDYFPTPNTARDARPDPKKAKSKQKKIRFIITDDTRNTLTGNACFEEATRSMGFMYMPVPPGQGPNRNRWAKGTHNFGAKFAILINNGPCWKRKVNKKREECRIKSGDYMGSIRGLNPLFSHEAHSP